MTAAHHGAGVMYHSSLTDLYALASPDAEVVLESVREQSFEILLPRNVVHPSVW